MNNLKILIADDEFRIRKIVKDYLIKSNFSVIEASNGQEAMDIFFSEKDISLVILDVMMPVADGWEALKEIRKYSKVPIIMLTAKGEERDELTGFGLGVDEYITKPFSNKVLVARIEALLRRTNSIPEELIEMFGITIDRAAHRVTYMGEDVELSVKEFELLTYFLLNKGVALSRENILNNVWNYDYYGDARTVDTHVKKLRSKIDALNTHIKTIWGMGYKFE